MKFNTYPSTLPQAKKKKKYVMVQERQTSRNNSLFVYPCLSKQLCQSNPFRINTKWLIRLCYQKYISFQTALFKLDKKRLL